MGTKHLDLARKVKNDEFYTLYEDIDAEIQHHTAHLHWKTVYCNCDNPEWSEFVRYFKDNFHHLGLKRLITTHLERDGKSYRSDTVACWNGLLTTNVDLEWNGDFRNQECKDILKSADIVITNPPFSLFREYIKTLEESGVDYLLVGSTTTTTTTTVDLYRRGRIRTWYTFPDKFRGQDWHIVKFGTTNWTTTFPVNWRKIEYSDSDIQYVKYDDVDAINIDRIKDIPKDYKWYMWVPETIFWFDFTEFDIIKELRPRINGKLKYRRILVKRKG